MHRSHHGLGELEAEILFLKVSWVQHIFSTDESMSHYKDDPIKMSQL
jgi:hypothetical protein